MLHDSTLDRTARGHAVSCTGPVSDRTLAQIKTAGPTKDYDGVYSTPSWTGEMFIDAIYADLTKRR